MMRKTVDKYLNKTVCIRFHKNWLNKATNCWIMNDTSFIGVLKRSSREGQGKFYVLEGCLPLNGSQFGLTMLYTIKEVKE